ncbi:putative indolepyruvate oxidoreductase subunit B [mine drainage metagenome]|uniref:Putative indolepyruvate oxidoreductase subunit B n=1 Tax=mine drainage metagenome TaxID=410659 RepID=A0A1J5QBN8_9ZZZZ
MQNGNAGSRPICLAILAMGGEGGGVLADWVVSLAEESGYWAQTTSVPGVAQRTGATIYYLEMLPRVSAQQPILSTMPTPGEVDIVVASELMEAGRAVQRGLVTTDRTTFITSTNRVYSMAERISMGDGRADSATLLDLCRSAAKSFIGADFAKVAEESSSVISAALFGALFGSGALPFSREQFEGAIQRSGVGVKASLAAFEAGSRVATAALKPAQAPSQAVSISIGTRPASPTDSAGPSQVEMAAVAANPTAAVGNKLQSQALRIANEFPIEAAFMMVTAVKRLAEYQDVRYCDEYLNRLAPISDLDRQFGDGTNRLTTEAARHLAVWMSYEDTIRVAAIKSRRKRMQQVSKVSMVTSKQLHQVHEFLHPQVEEIADTLPTSAGKWLLRSKGLGGLIRRVSANGIKVQSTSITGYTSLYVLGRLTKLRRRSLRFGQEQVRIESWLTQVRDLATKDYDLAYELVLCQNIVKGYGETHKNGLANFNLIMSELPFLVSLPDAAGQLRVLRSAALADENGEKLRELLSK